MLLHVVNSTIINTSKQVGHVAPGVTLERVKSRLAEVRGHLVEHPLDFLIEEKVCNVSMEIHSCAYSSIGPLGEHRLARTQPYTPCVHLSDTCISTS
jgi:hypothetical protein